MLNQGAVFGSRSFDVMAGDLTVGNGVQAQTVAISVDAGSLTVNGTIDASGALPGSITLAGMNGLTIAAGAVLDAHATALQVDSYGQPVASPRTPPRSNLTSAAPGSMLSRSPRALRWTCHRPTAWRAARWC